MEDTLGFLQAILPPEGITCAVHLLPDGSRRTYWYDSLDELAAGLLRLDTLGGNVYHGCAAYSGELRQTAGDVAKGYKPRRHREKHDVVALKSFWLDIDVAPKSSYADARTAAEAVYSFCDGLGLRYPLLVGSGAGLHPYFPLSELIGRDEWQRYAAGLKGACEHFKLEAGRERTADCASILRSPGTNHRKGEPQLVRCGPIVKPFALSDLDVWLDFVVDRPPARSVLVTGGKLRSKLRKSPEFVDFNKLADRCAQLGAVRANGADGTIGEPIWHATTVLLAHCHKGEEAAHAWSDPSWHEAIDGYLERGRQRTGPTTCAHFKSINPDGCRGCPYSVTTPLGVLDAVPAVGLGGDAVDGGLSTYIPRDFSCTSEGLFLRAEGFGGKDVDRKLSNYPVYLASVQFGEIRTSGRVYLLRHFLPHHGWHGIELSASAMRGPAALGALAELGLNIHDGEGLRKFVVDSVDLYNKSKPMQVQYEQYGWKDETSFLYGSRLYTPAATIEVPASTELKFRNQWLMPRAGGSANEWKAAADRLFSAGSEGQSFAILGAFAAPLMRFVNDNEGGAIVSIVTRATATGKSTALSGAYTVYASDRRALSLTTIDTGNSKGVAMATIGNLPVIHDEFQGDPEVTRNFVKLFTEGRDKQRLDRDGQMRHTVGTWQTLLFTASNTSLVDSIGALSGSDALGYRILEFPVESAGAFSPAEADRLRKQLELNAGWAGHAYLEYLVRPDVNKWVKASLPTAMEEIYRRGSFTREHRFWVRTLACVAVAAQIVDHLALVAFSPERIVNWAIEYFASKDRATPKEARYWLSMFINAHAGEMLVVPTAFDARKKLGVVVPPRIPSRLTLRREEDTGRYYIAYDALKSWLVKHDVGMSEFVWELEHQKIVLSVRGKTLGAGTNLGGGQVRCVEVDGAHPQFSGMLRVEDGVDTRSKSI